MSLTCFFLLFSMWLLRIFKLHMACIIFILNSTGNRYRMETNHTCAEGYTRMWSYGLWEPGLTSYEAGGRKAEAVLMKNKTT